MARFLPGLCLLCSFALAQSDKLLGHTVLNEELEPFDVEEALEANDLHYAKVVPFSLDVHFVNGKVASFFEGRLP